MRLTTPRLVLRDFVEADWRAVWTYQNKPEYLRYYPWERRSQADVREFVGMFITQQRQAPRYKYQLAITRREDGLLIGNCGVRMDAPGAKQADIGYELDPLYWGQGYATEAAGCLVRYGFEELGVHRIWSWCIADNAASARVLEKLGLRLEGRLRHNENFKGRWWDTLMYGLLEDEWRGMDGSGSAPTTSTSP